jgi:hypothetical protein
MVREFTGSREAEVLKFSVEADGADFIKPSGSGSIEIFSRNRSIEIDTFSVALISLKLAVTNVGLVTSKTSRSKNLLG